MNRFERLRGGAPLVVYLDFKSPYAFVAIEPTRAVARAAGVAVDWRPFTLDIPSYLGSARLDRAGRVVENRRSAAQWSGVRYAYRDARRYAELQGRVLRGTEKIWDSALAGIGLLWAKRHSAAVVDHYLDDCYTRFWQRALDIESLDVISACLAAAGADVAGFTAFAAGPGRAEHDRINEAAFAAGIFGVPSYLVADEFWFGREHLPRVAWLLGGRSGTAPDIAYPVRGLPVTAPCAAPGNATADPARLTVAIDIRDPQTWLAWQPLRQFAGVHRIALDWQPYEVAAPNAPPRPAADEDRGIAHRRYRAEQQAREIECYAAVQGLPLAGWYRHEDACAAHLALLWARRGDPARADAWLDGILSACWSGGLDPADPDALAARLAAAGIATDGFKHWLETQGPAALAAVREQLQSCGVFQVPTVICAGEPFLGRAHLPFIAERLEVAGREGSSF